MQVAIHALWYIGMLTGNGARGNAPPTFLSVPIFRYLYNNGTFIAEDFMFHAFITCAMIGDKTVNDATLSTNTWWVVFRSTQPMNADSFQEPLDPYPSGYSQCNRKIRPQLP